MIEKFNRLLKDGLFHIVGAGTINKVISLCSGIIIVRVLNQYDYGVYSYVLNIVNIVLLLNGLGTLTGILQYGCEYRNNFKLKNAFIKYGMKLGLGFNLLLSVAIIVYGLFFPQSIPNTSHLFVLAAFIPVSSYFSEVYGVVLRINEENKKYSYFTSMNSFLTLSLILLGAFFYSVKGAILFRYFATIVSIFVGYYLFTCIREAVRGNPKNLNDVYKKSFLSFSLISCANNSVAHLFYNIDIFLIGLMIADATIIASYKVATTIPLALTFITTSIMTYVYPKFVNNMKNKKWLKKKYTALIGALLLINGFIAILLFVSAPWVIKIVFGSQYVDESTIIFRILIIGFFISSTLRTPSGSILDMLHLVKPNLYISIICGISNVLLDIVLIHYYGSIGAAIATTSTYLLYGLLCNSVLFFYIHRLPLANE